jgi:hypothetical protein
MRRLIVAFALALFMKFPSMSAEAAIIQVPLETQAALAQADAAARGPWIYGAAIVLAGIAIGAGIYLAARAGRRP